MIPDDGKDTINQASERPDSDADSNFTSDSDANEIIGDGDNIFAGNDAAQ